MTSSQFITFLLTIIFLVSCRETYRLSESDKVWMPYNGNETLIFASSIGEVDTFFFLRRDTLTAYADAQSLNGRTYEEIAILFRHSDSSIPGSSNQYYFLKLAKSKDKEARLLIWLGSHKASFHRISGLNLDSLSKINPTSLVINSKSYTDVFIIEDDDDWINPNLKDSYIKRLYWSKSEGLIRYDKLDGNYWELIKKYSP